MASDEQIKADNIDTIDNFLISGCLNPGMPYEKLSNANIIIVIGSPKEMITPNPLCRQNSKPITSHAISLKIKAIHNVISSHFILHYDSTWYVLNVQYNPETDHSNLISF